MLAQTGILKYFVKSSPKDGQKYSANTPKVIQNSLHFGYEAQVRLLGGKWGCNDKKERTNHGVVTGDEQEAGHHTSCFDHVELFVSVLALGCFSSENGRKECAGNFIIFFFPDSYQSGKIIQTDLSSNSFRFRAVSKFPAKKEFCLKKSQQTAV